MPVIEFQNLTKVYHLAGFLKTRQAPGIDSFSLEINEGEIFGLLGLNGSGKTTSLRLLLGLIRPTGGRVLVLGSDSARDPAVRSRLGYLPETVSFPGTLTPREILRFFARIDARASQRKDELEARITETLRIVGLSAAGERRTAGFSKGMIQRLGIAQAIFHQPKILVLDEPASGLDPLGIVEMRELFLKLNQELKITILFSSHSIGEVEKVSHRVAIIAGSRLQKILTKAEWQNGQSLEKLFLDAVRPIQSAGAHV
ncbi:MAG: ABC transporter ATP-binding protein [Elusimicrobia bacterium]|nr:ABC transporter ATP-binding protein [Elusimicrobiota bacterium]